MEPKAGSDIHQTQVEFDSFPGVALRIQGTMVYDFAPMALEGFKVRDVARPEVEDSVLTYWESYHNE